MVERWWGRRGVFAEDFADLVWTAFEGMPETYLEVPRFKGNRPDTLSRQEFFFLLGDYACYDKNLPWKN